MQIQFKHGIASFATVVMSLVFAALTGCEKKPEVYAERGADPAYVGALEASVGKQTKLMASRSRVVAQMSALEKRAREALPKDATLDSVRAELEGNPQKYVGWKMLSETLADIDTRLAQENARARALVQNRILKEAKDAESVAAGRATVKKQSANN